MRKYDIEQQAGKKILGGPSVAAVSRDWRVAEGILRAWKKVKLETRLGAEEGVIELRKGLKKVEMDNAHPKKDGSYLQTGKLKNKLFRQSISGKGNCYDNGVPRRWAKEAILSNAELPKRWGMRWSNKSGTKTLL